MKLNSERGSEFSKKLISAFFEFAEDSLTILEELVLSGDVQTLEYHIARDKTRSNYTFDITQNNSLFQFAVLTRNPDMVHALLKEPGSLSLLNKGDLVTGFTALHFAVITENEEMIRLISKLGGDAGKLDNFNATCLDYARLLCLVPCHQYHIDHLQVWNEQEKKIELWPIEKVEIDLKFKFQPVITCGPDYLLELLFSGFVVGKLDMEFRQKYIPQIEKSSGDENLILRFINEDVGWGVFAGKDYQQGDYIVRYGGFLNVKGEERRKKQQRKE
jgi:hypothetical protein